VAGNRCVFRNVSLPAGCATEFRLFVAAVTCYLLGRVFSADPSHPETVVNRMTAAFGLEFLIASWRSLWERS